MVDPFFGVIEFNYILYNVINKYPLKVPRSPKQLYKCHAKGIKNPHMSTKCPQIQKSPQ